jgi:ABC-2 type transport system permease protein
MRYWAAAGAIVRRDLIIFTSYRLRFYAQILSMLFSLALFYYVSRLVSVESFGSPDDYYAFVVVGLVVIQVLQSTLDIPMSVRQELVAGTFERMLVSPFGPVAGIVSMMAFPFLSAMLSSVIMIGLASLIFGLELQWSTVPLVLPFALLGSASFACFAALFTSLTLVVKQGTGTTWLVAGITLVAGAYFPIALLPDWIQWVSDVQPFTPAVDLMRHALVGTELRESVGTSVGKIVGFTVFLGPVAAVTLAWAVRYSRRQGTIAEY